MQRRGSSLDLLLGQRGMLYAQWLRRAPDKVTEATTDPHLSTCDWIHVRAPSPPVSFCSMQLPSWLDRIHDLWWSTSSCCSVVQVCICSPGFQQRLLKGSPLAGPSNVSYRLPSLAPRQSHSYKAQWEQAHLKCNAFSAIKGELPIDSRHLQ